MSNCSCIRCHLTNGFLEIGAISCQPVINLASRTIFICHNDNELQNDYIIPSNQLRTVEINHILYLKPGVSNSTRVLSSDTIFPISSTQPHISCSVRVNNLFFNNHQDHGPMAPAVGKTPRPICNGDLVPAAWRFMAPAAAAAATEGIILMRTNPIIYLYAVLHIAVRSGPGVMIITQHDARILEYGAVDSCVYVFIIFTMAQPRASRQMRRVIQKIIIKSGRRAAADEFWDRDGIIIEHRALDPI